MKLLVVVAAALALAACSKSSDSSDHGAAAAGGACADAAAKAVGALPAGAGAAEVQTKLKQVLTTRCTDDKWPAATIECYATQVKDMSGMRTCRETLPAEQQQKLMADIRTVMMSAMGGAGPMHGGPGAH